MSRNIFAFLPDDDEGEGVPVAVEAPKPTRRDDAKADKGKPANNQGQKASNDRPASSSAGGARGGRGGRGGARGGRGGGGGGREFDRRSGTGRGNEMKKGGAGGHNWGQEDTQAPKPTDDVEATPTDGEVDASPADETAKEPKELTLDEYQKILAAKREGLNPSLKARAGGEGVNNKEWNKYQALDKSKATEDGSGLYDTTPEPVAKSKSKESSHQASAQKVLFDAKQLGFQAPKSDDFGGGRGRGRGDRPQRGRGGGGGRGREPQAQAPNIGDSSAFPSLG